ncbi:hypothetical protein SEA_KOZIE_2 [Microbacterium phage Kozie]|uniref:Amino acid:DNA transferase domain-containing protein n=1 Tax=Microbacterium phage Kozie TaxID=2885981 RepID=A0AAE8Y8U1_9CAUD|nr:hypothetical protein QC998_gp02 [Microbacterium phage Kozie]UDL16198.1 hypothetical protein SEA_KOZIE_2 [Microbacterium phage Kozie]
MTAPTIAAANRARLADYRVWHHAQVASGDIDPMYPVLSALSDSWGLDAEERAWLVFLHVAWYHPGSTIAAFQRVARVDDLPRTYDGLERLGLLDLPTGTERRGHRSKDNLAKHLLGVAPMLDAAGGALAWAQRELGGERHRLGWTRLYDAYTTMPGNGRWAAYKMTEMMQKVCRLPIAAADAGHAYSTGPRKGLADLGLDTAGNGAAALRYLDTITGLLAETLHEPDLAQVETSLCDFHSLVKGRYYLGHDIDAMLADWLSPRLPKGAIPEAAWDARAASFEPHLLGEMNGWTGLRRVRQTLYRDHGHMLGAVEAA